MAGILSRLPVAEAAVIVEGAVAACGAPAAQPQVAATRTSSDAALAGVRATARRFMAGAQRTVSARAFSPGLNAPAQSAAKNAQFSALASAEAVGKLAFGAMPYQA